MKSFKLKTLSHLVRDKAIFQTVWVVLRVLGGELGDGLGGGLQRGLQMRLQTGLAQVR